MAAKTKKIPAKKMMVGGLLYVLLFSGSAGNITGTDSDKKCGGTDGWDEKVLVDKGASDIIQTPRRTTIADLNAIVTDEEKRTKDEPRMSFEKQIVTVKNCLIRAVLRENDNDYHLVVTDRQGNHLIAEIPDPKCPDAKHSEYLDQFSQARAMMEKYGSSFQHYEFNITGVPFRDRSHGQTGRADNNLEIHPVLNMRVAKKLPF